MKLYILWVLLFGPLSTPQPTGTFLDEQACIDTASHLVLSLHGRGTAFCTPNDK